MCTLSFLPDDEGGFLLGLNRDELPTREQAQPPRVHHVGDRRVLAPRDPTGGGTWVAMDSRGHALCLLNGDSRRLMPPTAGAPSRGLLVTELIRDARPEAVRDSLRVRERNGRMRENSFRLYVTDPRNRSGVLHRFEWNGEEIREDLLCGPSLEVSNGYDQQRVRDRRNASFEEWQRRHGRPDQEALAEWHASHPAGRGDVFSVCMHHTVASTVSATFLRVTGGEVSMSYRAGQPCENQGLAVVRSNREV